jgi:hypothetical protein
VAIVLNTATSSDSARNVPDNIIEEMLNNKPARNFVDITQSFIVLGNKLL